jgi:phosphoesterase RecJ-like protein
VSSRNPRLEVAAAALCAARRPLLFCHRSPDGDTVGAALGLAMGLRRLGLEPVVVCPDALPSYLTFVPESDSITSRIPDDPDLLVTVDISDPGMLGPMRADLELLRPGRTLLNIDHHASDTEYGDLNVVDVTAASTAEIIFDLLAVLGVPVEQPIATALLTGIINDTHSFQNANSSERAFDTAAQLVAAGAQPSPIAYNLLLRRRPQAAMLWARTLSTMRFDDEGHVVSAFATAEMMSECGADTEDMDGIVEFMRNIDGVDLAFLLKGLPDGSFKVSIRTSCAVDAVELTAPFGGGGHRRAAGCDLPGPAESARARLLDRYRELAAANETTAVVATESTPIPLQGQRS